MKVQKAFNKFGVKDRLMVYECKYTPKIETKSMIRLYKIKKDTGKTIVNLVNEAVKNYYKIA